MPIYCKAFQGGYTISSRFGSRVDPISESVSYHLGVDFPLPIGTPLFAVDDGIVRRTSIDQYGGKWIDLVSSSDGKMFRYLHLSSFGVNVGQTVKKAQLIGFSGNTGYSTGPHLHLEMAVRFDGQRIDPETNLLPFWKEVSYFSQPKTPVYMTQAQKNQLIQIIKANSTLSNPQLHIDNIQSERFDIVLQDILNALTSARQASNVYVSLKQKLKDLIARFNSSPVRPGINNTQFHIHAIDNDKIENSYDDLLSKL